MGDVRGVSLAASAGPEIDQPLVRGGIARLEEVRGFVSDDADRESEVVISRTHPLGIAAGEVVVDRDHVNAVAGQSIENRGDRRDERLALAGLHFGDAALVKDDRAEHLDIEGTHSQGASHGFSRGRERFGQDTIHGVLDAIVFALEAILLQLATPLTLGLVKFVVRWFFGFGSIENLLAQFVEQCADLIVRMSLHLGLEFVDPIDERFESTKLAVVRVDEAAQEAKH